MSSDDVRGSVLDTIRSIAPEAQTLHIPNDVPLRHAIELDSLDWLNVFGSLEQKLGIEIPTSAHSRLSTIDAIVDYVTARQGGTSPTLSVQSKPPDVLQSQHVVNGEPVCIRPIRDDDKALEADFVRNLSSLSRYQRFMATLNELPPAKLEELTHVDQQHHIAIVAETSHAGQPRIVGVARYVVDASGTGCEFAVAIDDGWHGSGLAGILMHKLITTARSHGLKTMEGLVLQANDKMLKLSRQLGFTLQRDPDDHETVRVVCGLTASNNT